MFTTYLYEMKPKANSTNRGSEPPWNKAPAFGRRETLLRSLRRLYEIHPGPVCIVETGTLRDDRPQAQIGDGWSTLAWGWFCAQTGSRAFTVDIEPSAIETCKRLTAEYASYIEYVTADSLQFFANWDRRTSGEIHLLYLDSFDYMDRERSEAHHLAEAQAALPLLAPTCLVLFDDTQMEGVAIDGVLSSIRGKGARAIPFLVENGFSLEWCGQGQALLSRGVLAKTRATSDRSVTEERSKNGANGGIASGSAYPFGITAIVHTRNEARNIAACLETLQGWTDEILVCDMESADETVAIAERCGAKILRHPLVANFDEARNFSAEHARYLWIFYLDADERVPASFGAILRRKLMTEGDGFEAMQFPFKHFVGGHWIRGLYPGYKAPSLYKKGCFVYNRRIHQGAQVQGRIAQFPANIPELAIRHYSYDSFAHYLDKMNRYTDTEAANLHEDGQTFGWQEAIAHAMRDFQMYYDQAGLAQDGPTGLIYSLSSAFYRIYEYAKLYELRYQANALTEAENAVPPNAAEVLEYALSVLQGGSDVVRDAVAAPTPMANMLDPRRPVRIVEGAEAQVLLSSPLASASGYGEEGRNLFFALEAAGVTVAAQNHPWPANAHAVTEAEGKRLLAAIERPVAPGFVHITHNLGPGLLRHPEARVAIGRTMFETDRLPLDWVMRCNQMDYVWVPGEFNRGTFAQSGVLPEKLVIMPGCFDPERYLRPGGRSPLAEEARNGSHFLFLSVFDWTLHKGWDVLLRAFLEAFEGRDDVTLLLKVWSAGYTPAQIEAQACTWVRENLGTELRQDARIRFLFDMFPSEELLNLYKNVDAFVLPSRGEGWGRPYMEAMACGLPVIGTNWSGNTAFMHAENSYLIDYRLQDVPEVGWREIGTYKGHRWAEPDAGHLRMLLARVVEEREEARRKGEVARSYVTERFNRTVVGKQMAQEIARVQEERRTDGAVLSSTALATPSEGNGRPTVPEETRIPVRWEGDIFARHSLAYVNRELCLGLLDTGKIGLSLYPTEAEPAAWDVEPRFARLAERCFASLPGPAEVHVRHRFPPNWTPHAEGKLVLIQPWEFGSVAKSWIGPILEQVSEVWCPSRSVWNVYRESGIPEEKLQIVPNGVDTRVFHPDAPPYVFTDEPGTQRVAGRSEKPFTFLFVGGTIFRKGIDILLDAYLRAFSALDDVCLVIKDTGTETVYRGMNQRERILELTRDTSRPAVVYLDSDLSAHALAGIYTACDCLVHPYRGEGFCLPALEAMACGLPVAVTGGGATDDFVDETVGWRIPAVRKGCAEQFQGEWECVSEPWMLEVSPDALARLLRTIYENRAEAQVRGKAATRRVQEHWRWDQACAVALARLEVLRGGPQPPDPRLPQTLVPRRGEGGELDGSLSGPGTVGALGRRKPRISLCMIVKNEERVLGDCLTSVRPWVDEIIIVDTGSTDRTVAIAESFGARVYHFAWCDSFSAARNESLKYATGDWILWVDADDTMPEASGQAIRRAVEMATDDLVAYVIPVQFVEEGGFAGGTRVDHVKLFRNLPGLAFEGHIHEQILPSLRRLSTGTIARCDAVVLHSGYDTSPEGQARKRLRDAKLLKLDLEERPNHPFVLFNMGMTDHYSGEHASAVTWLRRCIAVSQSGESHLRKAYALLATSLRELERKEECLATLEEGLRAVPGDPELHFLTGYALTAFERYAEAREQYRQVVGTDIRSHFSSVDMGILGYKTYHNLASVCLMLGDYAEAKDYWLKAIADAPKFLPSAFTLFNAALDQRDLPTAARMLDAVRTVEGTSENWASMVVRYEMLAHSAEAADRVLREVIAEDAACSGPRLVLARRLLERGDEAGAEEHLLALKEQGVAEAAFYLGVSAIRRDDLRGALQWMEQAAVLNPGHSETLAQIGNLKRALAG